MMVVVSAISVPAYIWHSGHDFMVPSCGTLDDLVVATRRS
jgi:hypothetical protein